ncbi:hypothetical protein LguiA_023484 [Lonicera macranthoides]
MQQSPSTTSSTTYTTIPISGADVISRSFQNLSTFVTRHRPWPEFISNFDRPDSLSDAGIRLRRNAKYFSVNYTIIISIIAAACLIGSPISLVIFALISLLWLVLYFFREDPMVVWGHHVSDWIVMLSLVIVTFLAVWFTGILVNLMIGIGVALLILAVHGILRNPEGLFLDENDAVSAGLIRARSAPISQFGDF